MENAAKENLKNILPTSGTAFFALKNDFNNEWYRFLHPNNENDDQILEFLLKIEHLPFYIISLSANKNIVLSKLDIIIDTIHNISFDATLQFPENNISSNEILNTDLSFGGMPHLEKSNWQQMTKVLGHWKIKLKKSPEAEYISLKPEDISNVYLVINFKIQ